MGEIDLLKETNEKSFLPSRQVCPVAVALRRAGYDVSRQWLVFMCNMTFSPDDWRRRKQENFHSDIRLLFIFRFHWDHQSHGLSEVRSVLLIHMVSLYTQWWKETFLDRKHQALLKEKRTSSKDTWSFSFIRMQLLFDVPALEGMHSFPKEYPSSTSKSFLSCEIQLIMLSFSLLLNRCNSFIKDERGRSSRVNSTRWKPLIIQTKLIRSRSLELRPGSEKTASASSDLIRWNRGKRHFRAD